MCRLHHALQSHSLHSFEIRSKSRSDVTSRQTSRCMLRSEASQRAWMPRQRDHSCAGNQQQEIKKQRDRPASVQHKPVLHSEQRWNRKRCVTASPCKKTGLEDQATITRHASALPSGRTNLPHFYNPVYFRTRPLYASRFGHVRSSEGQIGPVLHSHRPDCVPVTVQPCG